MLKALILGTLFQQTTVTLAGIKERHTIYQQARQFADETGKPLLVVGAPKLLLFHGCGDITIDIDPNLGTPCDVELADVRQIPYPDGYFGAAFVSHVLEHLATIEDAEDALNELHRVADKVFVASPSKFSMIAWIHPGHHLWVTSSGDGYMLEQRSLPSRHKSYVIAFGVSNG